MPHATSLITTLAAGFGLALLLGLVAVRLRLPALVGYLVAGILIGPGTPGFVADLELAGQLAEVGVMLLMFGVGLHFSVDELLAVRKVALPGALAQMAVATLLGLALASAWGWSLGAGLVFGLALSVASTVVLLKALESRGQLESANGRLAVGWLVVEDLAMVLVLVLLPALAGAPGAAGEAPEAGLLATLGRTLLAVAAFVLLMWGLGRRLFPWLLWQVARTGSRELFTLGVIAAAITLAYGSAALFGVSFALGAFFAGLVLRESAYCHRAADESLPLRDAFAVLFFVSVGMLFDPRVILDRPLQVLGTVAIIMVGKSLAATAVMLAFRYPLNTALTVSAGLAQIGEFSFILASLGVALGLLPREGQSLILAGALISIALNPLLFHGVEPLRRRLLARSAWARRFELRDDPLSELPANTPPQHCADHVVLVGHGRVGRPIAAALRAAGRPVVVAEQQRERVEALREQGWAVVLGDATEPGVLIQAHVARARMLVVTVPHPVDVPAMVETARQLNPKIALVLRAHDEDEAARLRQATGAEVFVAEQTLADALVRRVLRADGAVPGG